MNIDLPKPKIKNLKSLKLIYLIAKLRIELDMKFGYSKKYMNIISILEYNCVKTNLTIINYN